MKIVQTIIRSRYFFDILMITVGVLLYFLWPNNFLLESHDLIFVNAAIIAACLGDIIIHPVTRRLKKPAERKIDNKKGVTMSSAWLGIVERTIYVASWLTGYPEFIVVWLTLKTVSTWNKWNEEDKIGRAKYNNFLTGMGLSLLFAVFISILALRVTGKCN